MFSDTILNLRYAHEKPGGGLENWDDISKRVAENVLSVVNLPNDIKQEIERVIRERKFIPGGRFLAQAGRKFHQTSNCFLLRAEDTREGWGDLLNKATVMLMSGGGIGIDYSRLRASGTLLKRTGGTSSGPLPLLKIVNEVGRGVMSGGKRRSAIYGSLAWNHPDILDFIHLKDWPDYIRKEKETNFDAPAPADMTNISVILDRNFFEAYDRGDSLAQNVYWQTVENMVKTGEPGFQIDFDNPNESLRNACTEIVSEDDCDVCVLGSINLAKIKDVAELADVTKLGTIFLLAGTEYTDVPDSRVRAVQLKNRRLGLGLMGLAEWLLVRGYQYKQNDELASWLTVWKEISRITADQFSDLWGWARPVAVRSIAPNGTISIAGGHTTSGIEPIFAVAFQRRYLTPQGWKMQYVIDPTAEKLIERGVNPEDIQDAYTLSYDVKQRIAFQAFIQKYVDNGISSTVNLPAYGTLGNDNYKQFGNTLYGYLPYLRGITTYPNGARGGQPLQVVEYDYAIKNKNRVFEANEDCAGGVCGI